MQSNPFTTVREMLSATLPFNKKLTRFDVTPPGQRVMMMKPTFTAGEKSANAIKIIAEIGCNIIWATKPMPNDPGKEMIFEKSFLLKFKPKLMVINAKTKSIRKSMFRNNRSNICFVAA